MMRVAVSRSVQFALVACGLFIVAVALGLFGYFVWSSIGSPEWLVIGGLVAMVLYLAHKVEELRDRVESQDMALHLRLLEIEAKMRGEK
jgi:hypothetical protein